ncbi:hypothetical protein CFP56_004864 [Quercus suber]|uniref:Uncharacterized protein n=1 Tax=Quercus suber TaxID=58331 RepID=A0AAW0L5B8_QUESU
MVEAAFGAINLELHSGTYPPLASLDEAAWLAKAVATDIANQFQAHPTSKAVDTIRRELGYYRPNFMGNQWARWTMPDMLLEKPNEGPSEVS